LLLATSYSVQDGDMPTFETRLINTRPLRRPDAQFTDGLVVLDTYKSKLNIVVNVIKPLQNVSQQYNIYTSSRDTNLAHHWRETDR